MLSHYVFLGNGGRGAEIRFEFIGTIWGGEINM